MKRIPAGGAMTAPPPVYPFDPGLTHQYPIRKSRAIHVAQIGAAVLGAEAISEGVVVVWFHRGITTELEIAGPIRWVLDVQSDLGLATMFFQPDTERKWPRWLQMVGLIGCLVLAVSLPMASVITGTAVLGLGALIWLARHRQPG